MKNLLLLFLFFFYLQLHAQVPQGIPYQSVVRNSNGSLISNQTVNIRFSIHDSSATGIIVYQESHASTTTTMGMLNLTVGKGTSSIGTFSGINWGNGNKFMQVELKVAGAANYIDLGTQQLLSVPYALYAAYAVNGPMGNLPTIETNTINNIKYSTASLEGKLVNNGDQLIISRGFCIGTTALPSIANAKVAVGNELGNYSLNISGLTPNTKYYVRAFAVSIAGTAYGRELNFTTQPLNIPTLLTDTLSNVSNHSVFAKATITDDGGSNIIEQGFCLSTSSMPTINSTKIQVPTASLSYNSSITSLLTNTTYYIRAYAINNQGVNYGNQQVFTTLSQPLPSLSTTSPTNLSYTSVTIGGQISNDGGTPVTKRGVCYSTSPNPTINQIVENAGTGMGTYTVNINNLNSNTTYYARAFASSLAGTAYGNEIVFTTLALTTPEIVTFNVAGIGGTTANSGGNIINTGGSAVSARGLCWSTNPNPTINDNKSSNGNGLGTFTAVINGLSLNTTYYVRAYATNIQGTAYGNELSFTTLSQLIAQPTTPILGSSLISKTSSSYQGGGFVSSNGGAQILQQGICWNTTGNPTLQDSVIYSDSIGLGYFNVKFNLPNTCNSTYYFRAFAINSVGIGYGQQTTVSSGLVPTFGQFNVTNQSNGHGLINATVSMQILSDGGCSVTERGFCWAVTPDPSFSEFHQSVGSGTGVYSGILDSLLSNTTYYIRPYVKTINGTYFGNQSSFVTNGINGLAIGQTYAGGVIFYIDSTGQHGLVCNPNLLFGTISCYNGNPWGCNGTKIGGTLTKIGSGAQNTALILGICSEPSISAKICDDLNYGGYNDWFLPSIDELSKMNILALNNIIPIPGMQGYNGTASSSEIDAYSYYAYYFGFDGHIMTGAKQNGNGVCSSTFAVRAF